MATPILPAAPISTPARKYRVGINRQVINKNQGKSFTAVTEGFQPEEVTIHELLGEVGKGHAIGPVFKLKDGKSARSKRGFVGSSLLMLDFDNDEAKLNGKPAFSLRDAQADPLIAQYGSIYTTASHLSDGKTDRYRVIFLLPNFIEDARTFNRLLAYFLTKYPMADQSCKDASRIFFGNTSASFLQVRDVCLPESKVTEMLQARIHQEFVEAVRKAEVRHHANRAVLTVLGHGHGDFSMDEARKALSFVPPRLPSSGNYQEWMYLVAACKSLYGETDAITLIEEASPSCPGWDVPSKVRSFPDEGAVGAGSLIHIARKYGYKPPRFIRPTASAPRFYQPTVTINERFLSGLTPSGKLVLLESSHGTGKTTVIESLLASSENVLVITHRRSLARKLSKDYGIPHYMDSGINLETHTGPLVVTYNSLTRLRKLGAYHNATIVLDEVVQGFGHMMGTTIKAHLRDRLLSDFRDLLRQAGQVIACDADMDDKTIEALLAATELTPADYYYLRNTFKKPGLQAQFYNTKKALISQVNADLKAGLSLALASSSKELTDQLYELITTEFPALKVRMVNVDYSEDEDTQDFITNCNTRVKEVDVLIYSPSMFTGVDINVKHFDGVYLFACDDVQSAKDLLQSINRVRNPKDPTVRIWCTDKQTSGLQLNWEAQFDFMQTEQYLYEKGKDMEALYDRHAFTSKPKTKHAWMLRWLARSIVEANAVKTDVKQALLAELSRRGYDITFNHDATDATTSKKYDNACQSVVEHREQGILSAPAITKMEYDDLSKKRHLTEAERFKVARYDYVQINHGSETDLDKLVKVPLDTLDAQVQNVRLLTEDVTDLHKWQRSSNRGIGLAADRSTFAEVAKLLQEIEATWDGIDHKGEIGSLDRFVNFMEANAERVRHLLGLRVRSNTQSQAMKLLGEYLNLYGLKKTSMSRKRVLRKQVNRYQIDEDSRTLMFRLAEQK